MNRLVFGLMMMAILQVSACKEEEGDASLDEASVARGEVLAEACRACHQLTSAENNVGPHLLGIIGRQVASVTDYAYSDAMAAQDFSWDREKLEAFIFDPEAEISGTAMAFGGVTKEEVADISEYIISLTR
jgi:cytochrome c2